MGNASIATPCQCQVALYISHVCVYKMHIIYDVHVLASKWRFCILI